MLRTPPPKKKKKDGELPSSDEAGVSPERFDAALGALLRTPPLRKGTTRPRKPGAKPKPRARSR
jgi:hypothetical protein